MRLMIVWCLTSFLWLSNALASVNITQIIGGASDSFIPPPPPCTTLGFSEEATLTLPTGFNNGVMLRVMKSRYHHIGYALTDDGTTARMVVFRLDTLAIIGSATITPSCTVYRCAQRLQGDIDADAKLYLFREAIQNGGVCAAGGSNCIAFSKWLPSATMEAEAITATNQTTNLDDARDDGAGFYLLINTTSAGARELRLFTKSGLGQISVGTSFGVAGFGHLSRSFNGSLYAMTISGAAGGPANGKRVPAGTSTSNATYSVSGSLGARLPTALYGLPTDDPAAVNKIATDSDITGGARAFRGYNNESGLANCCTGSYALGGTDGSAIFQGAFYDPINNKVFAGRTDTGAEEIIRTTAGPNTLTVEETLNCVACNYNTGAGSGSQIIDYAPQNMRLYTVSDASPAVVTKIKVCATGGPPA